ncbi:MAG: hypothetical protein K6G15_01305 [Desulfovibrio sp.]|nr:hypothetical protein [Desulfovibrio sp.]
MLRHLCDTAQKQGRIHDLWGMNAATDFAVLLQLEAGTCDAVLRENGLDSPLGRAALRGADFREAATQAVLSLHSNHTTADIQRVVQEQAQNYLAAHGAALRSLDTAAQNLNEHQLDMLVRVAVPFVALSQTTADAQSSDVALLRQANLAAEKFFSPGMTADDRSVVVKTLTKALFGQKDQDSMTTACQNAKSRLESLLGQLQTVLQQPGTSPLIRECCDNTATLLNVFYANMLEYVPEQQQQALLLQPQQHPAANPQMALQMEPPLPGVGNLPLQHIPRKATSAEIFTAVHKLEANGENKLAAYLLPIMEKTGCADTELLNRLSGFATSRLQTAFASLHTNGDYATDLKHFYNDLKQFGDDIQAAAARFPQYASGEIAKLRVDMFIATHTDEELAKTLDALQSPEAQLGLSVLYNHAIKENEALSTLPAAQSDIAARSKASLNTVFATLGTLPLLMHGIAAKLGRPEPGPLVFDPDKSIRDLPQHDQLAPILPSLFHAHLNKLDTRLFPIKANLSQNQYDQLKNFFANLTLPDGSKVGSYDEVQSREFAVDNPHRDEDDPETWSVDTLAMVLSFHAWSLSRLLEQTNGQPQPAQLWGVLHGGQPPQDLNLDNFTAKLMQRMSEEVDAFETMLGNKLTSLDNFVFNAHNNYGIPPFVLMDKFSNVQHEDVTLRMRDQTLHQGLFDLKPNTQFMHGKDAYGFGCDFIRAGMPPGAKHVSDEGCKITIVSAGQEHVFTWKEYVDFTRSEAEQGRTYPSGELGHPYMQNIVNAARPLCQNDLQLGTVGLCTTQAVQMALRYSGQIYKDVSGGALEHTALDHRIEAGENGTVKVTITEKPGSLFRFRMEISVDPQGNPTMNQGEITFPSLDKWNAYKQEHPEERLR